MKLLERCLPSIATLSEVATVNGNRNHLYGGWQALFPGI